MMRSRLGLSAVGLCLALAGLMAVGAGSTRAEAGANWRVSNVNGTTLLPELTGSLEGNHGVLLAEIAGIGIHVLCTGATAVAGNHLLAAGGWLGKMTFSGCEIFRLKTLNNPATLQLLVGCGPEKGLIVSETLKGLLQLHVLGGGVKDTVTVLEPSVGTLLATIFTSEECAFGETIKVSGKLAVTDAAVGTEAVTHLVTEFASLTKLFINGNEANKATLDGSANISLTGVHASLKWSGVPG